MDTIAIKKGDKEYIYGPVDGEYVLQDGQCVSLPSGEVYCVNTSDMSLEEVDPKTHMKNSVVLELIKVEIV